jgi:hypothetical protein
MFVPSLKHSLSPEQYILLSLPITRTIKPRFFVSSLTFCASLQFSLDQAPRFEMGTPLPRKGIAGRS